MARDQARGGESRDSDAADSKSGLVRGPAAQAGQSVEAGGNRL